MNQRGEYGARRLRDFASYGRQPAVGAQAFDSDAAFRQIDSEMEAIVDAVYRAMGVDPAVVRKPVVADAAWTERVRSAAAKAKQSPLWPYWESSVSPKYEDWHAQGRSAIGTPEDYDRWLGRVLALRAEVKAKGIKLETPDPTSIAQAATPGSGIPRWAVIGGVAVGGLALVAALTSSFGGHAR